MNLHSTGLHTKLMNVFTEILNPKADICVVAGDESGCEDPGQRDEAAVHAALDHPGRGIGVRGHRVGPARGQPQPLLLPPLPRHHTALHLPDGSTHTQVSGTVQPLVTGPSLSRYLDITMNSQIVDFYYLFTSIFWIYYTYPDITLLSQEVWLRGVVLYSVTARTCILHFIIHLATAECDTAL